MQSYYLVIDTETSGLPKNWKAPYSKENNWPHIIQIAWIVYDRYATEVDRKNLFIRNDDFSIEESSQKIHHITSEFLQLHGKPLNIVMQQFYDDVLKYQPTIIGHFIEFDYHMVNVEFFRLGIPNALLHLPIFCTMKASKSYVKNPSVELLKLNDFYQELFNESPKDFHNALSDALNTAKIYFHLLEQKEITDISIAQQQEEFSWRSKTNSHATNLFNRLFSF